VELRFKIWEIFIKIQDFDWDFERFKDLKKDLKYF